MPEGRKETTTMEKTRKIILSNESTYEAIGELNSGHCRPVANDEGKKFTSVTDAARYADVTVQNMWNHLNGNNRTCKGHVYFYIDKRDESFDRVMNRLSEVSAEAERRKADEEDARKWREYQAEQEAIRKAEEKRIEDERKAKEEYENKVARAIAKIERRRIIRQRAVQHLNDVIEREMEAEKEYEALTGMAYEEKEDVA